MFDRRRPDPALGVFETMLVLDGRPVELDAHLGRLAASLAELFPAQAPPSLKLPDCREGALRVAVAPGAGGRLTVEAEVRESHGDFLPLSESKSPAARIELISVTLEGGLGAHKWADRSLLDEAQARLPADALPLLVDRDGTVLEASRANVFIVRDEALLTPPADGRILPGVTRMRVIELSAAMGIEASERELSCDDLLAADEVFLTGSVRGVERVAALDGIGLSDGGEVAARIAGELRRAWLGAEFG